MSNDTPSKPNTSRSKMSRKYYWNRRDLLIGAGVAAAMLGFRRQMTRLAHANGTGSKRLIVFWTPNGRVQEDFWPTGSTNDFSLGAGMAPLEPHKKDLTILKGITYAGTGDHKTGQPFSTSGFPRDNAGPSIDQEIAAGLGESSHVVCGQSKNQNRRGFISFDKSGAWVTPVRSVQSAYESVFGPIGNGGGSGQPMTGGRDAELEAKILDTAIADIEAVRRRLPESELVKMDDHLDAVMSLRSKVSDDPVLIECDQNGSAYLGDADYAKRVQLHSDIIASSIACDARRIFSHMLAPAGHDSTSWGFIGVSGGDIHNDVAHSSHESGSAMDKMRKVGLWETEQLAHLIENLKSIPEGDGTAFDNTVILWTTECTHGNHGHRNIPNVLIGSCAGALKTGRFLDFEKNPGWENVLICLSHAMGHEISSFGENGSGPLSDILT